MTVETSQDEYWNVRVVENLSELYNKQSETSGGESYMLKIFYKYLVFNHILQLEYKSSKIAVSTGNPQQ